MKRLIMAILAMIVLWFSFQYRSANFAGWLIGNIDMVVLPWMLICNKILRYLVNDLAALALIWAIFQRQDFVRFSILVLLFGLFILLPLYFIGYFYFSHSLGITLSYLHRLVMNPTLMMLLIPFFFLHKKMTPIQ